MAASRVGKLTIVDVAASSGVSVTTVSRILNNKPDVAHETRERVLRVMDEIGFAPQSAWRQIRSGRSGLIGLHVPPDFNPPNLPVIMAAALGVEDAGYSINIITRALTDADLLGIFRSREVDGIIFSEVLADDPRPELLRDHGYPFVMIGRRADNTGLNYVDLDIDHAIGIAIDHLVELGHRSIVFLTFDPVVQEKRYGFIAPHELSAVAVLRATRARRLRIPDEVSVVAILGEISGEIATPPLTTVAFPAEEMGTEAARILIGTLGRGGPSVEQVLLRTELHVRGSTAAPRTPT